MVPIERLIANRPGVRSQQSQPEKTTSTNLNNRNPYLNSNSQTTTTAQDTVTRSEESNALDQIRQRVVDSPEIDTEKVARLRALVDSGEYTVDSAQVAEKILATGVLPSNQ